MVTYSSINPDSVPMTWEKYLEWVLDIEMKLREDRKPSTSSSQSNTAKATKDPNAMEIDIIKKVEKLSKEQEEWLAKGACFRCGKHKVKRGERCRSPKYKGFYELPASSSSQNTQKSTTVRTVEVSTEQDEKKDREQFIQMCLAQFDAKKGKEKEPAKAAEMVAARIEEIPEEDFLQRVL